MKTSFRGNLLPAVAHCFIMAALLAGCGNGERSDGYGNFEATEVIVSSETAGKLLKLDAEEGVHLAKGAIVAVIDTTQLDLSRKQLQAERDALLARKPSVAAEADVYRQRRRNIQRDVERYRRLASEGAVAKKQYEDLQEEALVYDRQVGSVTSKNPEITKQISAMEARIGQIGDQITRSVVRNPVDGIVLTKYAEQGEVVSYGKPLYKIAGIESLYLRVYLSGSQLSRVRLGQEVEVLIDGKKPADRSLKGVVTWISSKTEFTPKIIQTREDRVNMVYAVKVQVQNRNGLLKIGMPGEIRITSGRGS